MAEKTDYSDQALLNDLNRLAEELGKEDLSTHDIRKHSNYSIEVYRTRFGGLNKAKEKIGLKINKSQRCSYSREDVYRGIDEFLQEHKREPKTINEVNDKLPFSYDVIQRIFGDLKEALRQFNVWKQARIEDHGTTNGSNGKSNSRDNGVMRCEYGQPLHFRGMSHAPINELGVVHLFGKVSEELGFIIESISDPFPDCEAKRKIEGKKQRWERVNIEFEYRSSHYRDHGHPVEGCDLIVCWIHDWDDCPLEVISLKDYVKEEKQNTKAS